MIVNFGNKQFINVFTGWTKLFITVVFKDLANHSGKNLEVVVVHRKMKRRLIAFVDWLAEEFRGIIL